MQELPKNSSLVDAVTAGRINNVELNSQVVDQELRRIGVVGKDSADFGGRQEHVLRPLRCEKIRDRGFRSTG